MSQLIPEFIIGDFSGFSLHAIFFSLFGFFVHVILYDSAGLAAERFPLADSGAGVDNVREQKKPEARKMAHPMTVSGGA
jgi:hypothetical protein